MNERTTKKQTKQTKTKQNKTKNLTWNSFIECRQKVIDSLFQVKGSQLDAVLPRNRNLLSVRKSCIFAKEFLDYIRT